MCPGVGHIGRGYETFSIELAAELHKVGMKNVILVKGAGNKTQNEIPVFCLKRTGKFTKTLSTWTGIGCYTLEQFTFFLSSLLLIVTRKPRVIIYSDFMLGVWLWYLRKFLKLKYKLLFSNGAPNGPPFTRCDFVQQLLPFYKQQAIDAGEDSARHFVLPYAIEIPTQSAEEMQRDRLKSRKDLDVTDSTVILCVAAINDSHKRISYLIDEVNALVNKKIVLIVLGQHNEESLKIIQKGTKLLGSKFIAKTVSKGELHQYYLAADVFVLPSLSEGLPRVMLEASSFGLPVFSHDYEVSRSVMGEFGYFTDFTQSGNLKNLLQEKLNDPTLMDLDATQRRRKYVRDYFSWDSLIIKYVSMVDHVISNSESPPNT